MPARTIADFCELWASGIESGEGHPYKQTNRCNVFVDGKTIYSYGVHFPMGYILAPNMVWLNGDRSSHSTSRHQGELRTVLRRNPSAQVIIVPGTALGAAQLDYRTIKPVDVHPDAWEYTLHKADTPPADMRTERKHSERDCNIYAAFGDSSGWDPWWQVADDAVGWISTENGRQTVVMDADCQYSWHTARHWLGDAVFTARPFQDETERWFISSFDRQESTPLYFLSQLPHPVVTFEDGIEALAPESVKTARDIGRGVVRQGDMFAIAMDVTTRQLRKQGAQFTRRHASIEWVPWAKQAIAKEAAVDAVKTTMPTAPVRQWATPGTPDYREEAQKLYNSWLAAEDAWYTELAKRCAFHYRELWPNGATRHTLQVFKPSRTHHTTRNVEGASLMGTAHTATEVATMPNGMQYARGCFYHEPAIINDRRPADHTRRRLGNGRIWHLITKNTVPVSGR